MDQLDATDSKKIKKYLKKSQEKYNNSKTQGHWTEQEHNTYIQFLMEHQTQTIENKLNKKNNKIFKLMSQTIGTRSPSQCRSHHQKFNPFTQQGQIRIFKNRKKQPIYDTVQKINYPIEQLKNYEDHNIQKQELNQDSIIQIFLPLQHPITYFETYISYDNSDQGIPYPNCYEMSNYIHEIITPYNRQKNPDEWEI